MRCSRAAKNAQPRLVGEGAVQILGGTGRVAVGDLAKQLLIMLGDDQAEVIDAHRQRRPERRRQMSALFDRSFPGHAEVFEGDAIVE